VQTASRFRSQVALVCEGRRRDGKSILGVLLLAAGQGSRLTLEVDGPDEEKAMAALERLVAEGFGEGVS
jgi:phosphocarrier protein HPr